MVVVARKSNLLDHVTTVLVTPFAFFLAMSFATWFWLLLIVVVCIMTGVVLGPPEPKTIFGVGFSVVFLWIIGTILTVFDHIRFRGWIDESSEEASQIAYDFAEAFLNGDRQRIEVLADFEVQPNKAGQGTDDWLVQLREQFPDDAVPASPADYGIPEHYFFRAAIREVKDQGNNRPDVVAFIPTISPAYFPIHQVQLIPTIGISLNEPFGPNSIVGVNVMSVCRPQI